MTIHGSGTPIYATEIVAEFGGGYPMYLSNYYAGGPYVPVGTTGQFGAIPSSGAISYVYFYGSSKEIIMDTFTVVSGVSGTFIGFFGGGAGGSSCSPQTANFTSPPGAQFFQLGYYYDSQDLVMFFYTSAANSGAVTLRTTRSGVVNNYPFSSATFDGFNYHFPSGGTTPFVNGQTTIVQIIR